MVLDLGVSQSIIGKANSSVIILTKFSESVLDPMGFAMPTGTTAPALDLGRIVEDLLPDIRIIVCASLCHFSHKSPNYEIDDLCQQIVVLLMDDDFRRLRSFDHASSHKTWLTAVVRNHVINHLRRQKTMISFDDLGPAAIRCPPLQDKQLIALELTNSVREALSKLTKREAKLFELCYLFGLSTVEIADGMGIKPQSVRRRKHAVTKKLRRLLQQ